MQRSVFETILGAVVLLIAAGFLFMAYQKTDMGAPAEGYRVIASFSSADGLKPGVDVRVAGVKVGNVAKLKLDGASYQALATLQLNNGVKIPTDSVAQIASDGLLGGKFINLQIGGADDNIPPNGKFEYTTAAANLEALLGQAIFSRQGGNGGDSAAPPPAAAPASTPAAQAPVMPTANPTAPVAAPATSPTEATPTTVQP